MSKLDLLKVLESFDGEAEIADFSVEELREMIANMQADGEEIPLSEAEFKKKYFDYYDDVKDKSLKRQDW